LSLDDEPQAEIKQEDISRDENAENIPPTPSANNFIAFVEHDNDNGDDEKEFFEISNSDIEDEGSSSSEEEEIAESESDESDIETIDVISSQDTTSQPIDNVGIKFRLSEQDLEEDGINPLDISARTDDDNNVADVKEEPEEVEIPATQDMFETTTENIFESQENSMSENSNNPMSDDIINDVDPNQEDEIEIPATQDMFANQDSLMKEEATEDISTEQMNDIIEGSGNVDLIDCTKTEDMESMIEEHLESSTTSAAATTIIAEESISGINEEAVDQVVEEAVDQVVEEAVDQIVEEALQKLPDTENSVTVEPVVQDENFAEESKLNEISKEIFEGK
jgi:hypothetical protein